MTTDLTSAAAPSIDPEPGYYTPLAEQQRVLSAEDRLDITDLVFRFEWCFDRRDYVSLTDMFTEDVVIDHMWGYREGREAALTLLREWEHANAGLRHQGTNLVIWAEDADNARAQSYLTGIVMSGPLTADSQAPALGRIVGHGLVTDRFRRCDDGLWRMTRRTIEQMYIDPEYLADEDARRWFALSAEQRRATNPRPAGWDPR
ncbi:nuclear transport factor 2 family protein [Nocardia sp. NPDC101769]|uniref:nuclear transport factor 2 family protein n=1 Tax=Nocardia sp. NPDC101769 TaxID=3364333 RepID=UPI003822411F